MRTTNVLIHLSAHIVLISKCKRYSNCRIAKVTLHSYQSSLTLFTSSSSLLHLLLNITNSSYIFHLNYFCQKHFDMNSWTQVNQVCVGKMSLFTSVSWITSSHTHRVREASGETCTPQRANQLETWQRQELKPNHHRHKNMKLYLSSSSHTVTFTSP